LSSNSNGDDSNIVEFPATAEERRALRKLQRDRERQRLVNVFVDENRALFRDPNGDAYADLIIDGHRESWRIRSMEFRGAYIAYLRRQIDRLVDEGSILAIVVKGAMSKNAINNAINEYEIRASSSTTPVHDVRVRIAGHDGDIYLDLCSPSWEAVRITAAGWSIVESPPVRFRRTRGMQPLPYPERGGKIEALRPFFNLKTEADFTVVVGFVLAALRSRGPYTILNPVGPPGAAKTRLLRLIRRLVDPHVAETTPLPSSGEDLFVSARNSFLLGFENVSRLSKAMSDHLCRMATGGSFRGRRRFTNSDENLHRGGRPIAFEGINNVVTEADMLDRILAIEVERVAEYEDDEVLDRAFERERPRILGALLDLLVNGLREFPTVRLTLPAPRMVGFVKWGTACGLAGFEQAYLSNRRDAVNTLLEYDAVAKAVRGLMDGRRKRWHGTATTLLEALGELPKIATPRMLSDRLRLLAPMLETVGIHVILGKRRNIERPLTIERQVTKVTNTSSPSSPSSPSQSGDPEPPR
jgi:hypothetical protein